MPAQQMILAYCVYLVVLAALAYFTRATPRRIVGAICGGVAIAIVGLGVEALAHTLGWWRYPGVDSPFGPPLIYPALVLMFAALALIGWRVTRRWGWRGQLIFIAIVMLVGTPRDYMFAARLPDFFVIAPGVGPMVADAVCWALAVSVALAGTRFVAGPARADRLARTPAAG